MLLRNCKPFIRIVLIILIMSLLSGCWKDIPPPSLITEQHKDGQSSCIFNGVEWKCDAFLYTFDSMLNINLLSEYSPGLGKQLRIRTPWNFEKARLNLSECNSCFYQFRTVDEDVSSGTWVMCDSVPDFNYIIIDSLNSDKTYIKGRFSCNFINTTPEADLWKNLNDSSLDEWIEIREGAFEGKVHKQ